MNKAEDDQMKAMAEGFLRYLEESEQEQNDQIIQDELDSVLGDLFPDEDTKAKARQIFIEAVNNKKSYLEEGIADILGGFLPLIENFDAVEMLTDRIAELEAEIAICEEEGLQLANEHVAQLSNSYGLNEDVVEALWTQSSGYSDLENKCQQIAKSERPARRSTVAETMEELNDSDFFTNGGTEFIDPQMRAYMKALGHK